MDIIFYKLPKEDTYFTLEGTEAERLSFFDFQGNKCYSFQGTPKAISQADMQQYRCYTTVLPKMDFIQHSEISEVDYVENIQKVIDFIKQNQLSKLVISREKHIEFPQGSRLDLVQTFLSLCKNYPSAFVYCFIKGEICWLGATPEILGDYNFDNQIFKTMSLAGTLPVEEAWTQKEIEEQKPVTQYIEEQLKIFSKEVKNSETYTVESGNIKHLRNDFEMKVPTNIVEDIIDKLHPTPAVCGVPKEFCKQAIDRFEAHKRMLYSGYIQLKHGHKLSYFVNLRCAHIYQDKAIAYVGGGITAYSNPKKEWQETELKSDAIVKNLIYKKRK